MKVPLAVAFIVAIGASLPAHAGVTVTDVWIKPTKQGQTATEAYLKIKSDVAAKLVGAGSPTARIVQIHEIKMNGGVMQMRAINSLDLPASQTVEFKPGGYHIMLSQLDRVLQEGATVQLTLTVEYADGHRQSIEVKAPVRAAMPTENRDDMEDMGNMKGMKGMDNGY